MAQIHNSRSQAKTVQKIIFAGIAAFMIFFLALPQAYALNCVKDCDISVRPHGTFAEFDISTPEPVAGFMVVISDDHPQPDGTVSNMVSKQGVSGPRAQALVRVGNLKPDTRYFYQVLAIQEWPGPDAGMFHIWGTRKFGAFWTLQRKTRVEFREVHMIDDADDWGGGDGDFTFWFWVHNEKPVKKEFGDGVVGSGEKHDINKTVEVVGLPDSITVAGYGWDDDQYDWPTQLCEESGEYPGDSPPSGGENNDDPACGYESAVGKTNLSLGPSDPFNELLNDKSFSFKAEEDWMEFDIHGRYSVEYEAASPSKPLPEVTQPPIVLRTWIYQPAEDNCTQPDWEPQTDSPYCTAVPIEIRSIEPDKAWLTIKWQKWRNGRWHPYCGSTNTHGLVSSEWFEKCTKFYRDHSPGELDILAPRVNFPVTGCQRVSATSVSESTGIKGPPSEWRTFYVPPSKPSMVNAKYVPPSTIFSEAGKITVKFTWTAGCANVAQWWLFVGTSSSSIGNIYNQSTGTTTSATVKGIPEQGNVYVRLRWQIPGEGWSHDDYTYNFARTIQ